MMVETSENATGLGDPTSDQEDERLKELVGPTVRNHRIPLIFSSGSCSHKS